MRVINCPFQQLQHEAERHAWQLNKSFLQKPDSSTRSAADPKNSEHFDGKKRLDLTLFVSRALGSEAYNKIRQVIILEYISF